MHSSFASSAAVPAPSVRVSVATVLPPAARLRRGSGSGAVASSIEALERACQLQSRRAKQQQEQEEQAAAAAAASAERGGRRHPSPSAASELHMQHPTMSGAGLQSSASFAHPNTSASGVFNPPSAQTAADKQSEILAHNLLMSRAVLDSKAQADRRYQTGYSAFEFALETAMQRLEKLRRAGDAATATATATATAAPKKARLAAAPADSAEEGISGAAGVEDRWRILANCLTSSSLHVDLHKICKDIETTVDQLASFRAHQLAREQKAAAAAASLAGAPANNTNNSNSGNGSVGVGLTASGSGIGAALTLLSPKRKTEQQAKARLNGMQTAMAAMLLEQALAAVGDAAPYCRPAMTWLLDTILGSIYVSYDIVRADIARTFEPLQLSPSSSPNDDGDGPHAAADPSDGAFLRSASHGGSGKQQWSTSGGHNNNLLGKGNTEKLISRFYGKTFFQSVRSLSVTAKAHADHAEEIERAKTRQSRVLERATTYWARYAMRRVLGAWRGFAKNEKVERALREQVEELGKRARYLKELNDQREREMSLANMGSIAGSSQEALQLQVRELQRALEFERRRATRAEAALAVRIVEEGNGGGGGALGGGSGGNDDGASSSFGGSPSVDITALRAEVAHYRAVAVESCRLGGIDLHELERAVSAQTNVLARGMH